MGDWSLVEGLRCPQCGSDQIEHITETKLKCLAHGGFFDLAVETSAYFVFENPVKDFEYRISSDFDIRRNENDGVVELRCLAAPINPPKPARCHYVSRNHATIRVSKKYVGTNSFNSTLVCRICCRFIDHSRFGTSVNGVRLLPNEPEELKNGDKIELAPGKVGSVAIRYEERSLQIT